MILSQNGKKFLKRVEGFVSCPYRDSVGVATVGIGTTVYPNGRAVSISDSCVDEAKAFEYLEDHTNKRIISKIKDLIKVNLNQNQTDAIISFVYNIGADGFKDSTLLERLNRNPNDVNGITAAFMMWINAKGKPILKERRRQEVKLYFS